MNKEKQLSCFQSFGWILGSCLLNHGNFTGFRQIMGSIAFFKSEISHYIGHIGSCLSNILLYKNVIL